MKAVIAGPRRAISTDRTAKGDLEFSWMHIELELEELPKRGDVIILNSGSSYCVKNVMWWVDGPENDAYWSFTGDYRTDEGQFQVVHIDVEPDNRPERYGYPAGLEEGVKRGGEEWLAKLRELVSLAQDAGTGAGLAIIDAWLARQEHSVAERKAAEAMQSRLTEEILARLRQEKEG